MSDVPVWNVFAYMDADEDGLTDENRRGVAEWQLDDVIRWCRTRGYDNIYLRRGTDTAAFKRTPSVGGVVHRMGDEWAA